jgi:hypothetical protein
MPRLSQNLYPDFRTDGGGTVPAVERQREEGQMYELGEITAPEFYLRSLGNVSDATLGTIAEKTVGPAMEAAGSLFPPLGIIAEPVTRRPENRKALWTRHGVSFVRQLHR